MISRQSAVLVVDVTNLPPLSKHWQPGPWPIPLPIDKFPDFIYRDVADKSARSEFFLTRTHPLLYGEGSEIRCHRTDINTTVAGWSVRSLDLIRYPNAVVTDRALLAIHVWRNSEDNRLPQDAIRHLADLRPNSSQDQGPKGRSNVETLLQSALPGSTLLDTRTGFVVSHTVWDQLPEFPNVTVPGPDATNSIGDSAPATDHASTNIRDTSELIWPRLLASANTQEAMAGDLRSVQPQSYDLELSRSWSAAILKTGVAFVGTSDAAEPFHELGESLVHSTFLDAVLVALLQRGCLDDMANSTARVWQQSNGLNQMDKIERRSIQLRSQVWWEEISTTVHVNHVLRELQAQHRMADQLDRLHGEIADMARYSQGRRTVRTNQLLNVLVAASFGLGIAALIADPGMIALLTGLGLGVVVLIAMLLWERRDRAG